MNNLKYFFEKICIRTKSHKELIIEECARLNLSSSETDMVYEYYKNNYKEFQINPKVFFSFDKIVNIIITKLQILTP